MIIRRLTLFAVAGSVGLVGLVPLASPSAADSTTSPSALSASQVAAAKVALDQTAWDIGPTRALTPAEAAAVNAKIAAANATPVYTTAGRTAAAATVPTSVALAANQNAQMTTYYCGPAAVREALGQRTVSDTQSGLASSLRTTTNGTAWSGVNANVSNPTGYPVPDVLNNRLRAHNDYFLYIPQAVADPATSTNVADYKNYLVHDTASNAAPVVGDAYEVPGGPHLVGHPNITIFHWFDIRGYTSSGVNTMYEDSVHGSSTSWAGSVPAYSTLASSTIVSIVGGRGYVW